MTLQSSGSISISEISAEKGVTASAGSDISLTNLSTSGINSASTSKPDGTIPHAMSEFYGYNHNATSASGSCYEVFASGNAVTVYWTDGNGVSRSGTLGSGSTVYLCSQITPYESNPADLVVTACNSSCTKVHTSISDANTDPCVC